MAKKKATRQKYAYVELSKSKFLIIKQAVGVDTMWHKYVECPSESSVRHVVATLNEAK